MDLLIKASEENMFIPSAASAVDSYKLSHKPAYPEDTTVVFNNWTPRSEKHLNIPAEFKMNQIIWAGGEAAMRDVIQLWQATFFDKPVDEVLERFSKLVAPFAGPDFDTSDLRALHSLGYLPLEVRMLDEGLRVPIGTACMTVHNTKPEYYWLTNYIESLFSAEGWKFPTSATIIDAYVRIATYWYEKTGAALGFLPFALHDFSFRGMSGIFDACKSGAGHMTSSMGTDTIPAAEYLQKHYPDPSVLFGCSVPAMEHSVQTAYANDYEYFRRVVTEIYPKGIVSVVCDGYDYWNVITNVVPALKQEILNREVNEYGLAKVVVRPDSGDPADIICGTLLTGGDTPEERGTVEELWKTFGGTTNEKGYRTLNPRIGLIYGDSITPERAYDIYRRLEARGFTADNIVLGIGSYTYQYQTRDTLGWAIKATAAVINNELIALYKDPKTDTTRTKKSAKGLIRVIKTDEGKLVQFDEQTVGAYLSDLNELKVFFKDGMYRAPTPFGVIRDRIATTR